MTKKPVQVTDVTLRDAHQSLIATRLRTEDMLPICEKMDQAGFWSLEVWGGATFDACVRFLKEDPWERLRQLRAALPNSRLQMLLRGQNLLGYRHYADDVVEAFVHKAAANGMDVFRVFDALNDLRNLETAMKAVKAAGKHAQGTICYTTSPVHTLDLFVQQAKDLVNMGADSVAIKDMAGLLTPYGTYDLVKALKEAVDVDIVIHSHSTSGLAPLCQMKAIEAGVDRIDTAISSFASGTSHPACESQVAALKGTEYDTGLDLEGLGEIADYFRDVRKKYHQFESEFTREDVSVQINQVPGGMMSNLANQLKEQNALDRIRDVFAEIPRVREDLGFPPLVTPTSQIVGTQAVYNVLAGERYKTITNEVKRYLQGGYGKAPAAVNAELQQQAIGTEGIIETRPADLLDAEMARLKADIGELALNDEDVLTFAMFPDLGREFLQQRAAGTLMPEALLAADVDSKSKMGVATEFVIDVHGESYDIAVTGVGDFGAGKRKIYLSMDGVPQEVIFEPLNEYVDDGASKGRKRATEPGHVTATMPGNVVDVLVKEGDTVKAGQAVMVAEAMKMETEISANIAGVIQAVYVTKGDRVTPGEVLIEIG
ncbi:MULTISPECIES: sodium-extruding oxaloacetate decarboxylase subunit alpha [unclassified Oceanobacter]|uniref:sodium-extruding oxaloacetate decarboxylase subunit alpha n=1 Tax=unclassified Oceanobacter TaxID=2620260 RepID=UPI0027372433|nr:MULTISPECIES: sodium-extruding oxaloacetate decarboxylase subunit alpha [unclassified Oceanobacter]MDP2505530.1 sodium-extruding oxaloacetate decarboxylase subunit alpha [Oceanobacter sp. 3_MG-2023]MDP2547105.1 sodium-extruding oxaloacetate decarboxylase subunit alpha [Oceanobacter sp. 4_MG-2023]MDP2609730.1 sodium-extruding oxaloacetate decarboxylase subunit alpha [Oceanobacter sp. 1_MG-2023]MDP2613061.1 sodium-extruding oxaloacetate decarboxylase subunit alpha [Oceanobacter sp. 2_MG-2023]